MISLLEEDPKVSWTITIAITIGIFFVSSLTFGGKPSLGFNIIPILYHFLAFFFLTFFLLISLVQGKKRNLFFLGIIFAILYSFSDEIHQLFVPTRTFTVFDLMIDLSGILLASFTYLILLKLKKFS